MLNSSLGEAKNLCQPRKSDILLKILKLQTYAVLTFQSFVSFFEIFFFLGIITHMKIREKTPSNTGKYRKNMVMLRSELGVQSWNMVNQYGKGRTTMAGGGPGDLRRAWTSCSNVTPCPWLQAGCFKQQDCWDEFLVYFLCEDILYIDIIIDTHSRCIYLYDVVCLFVCIVDVKPPPARCFAMPR